MTPNLSFSRPSRFRRGFSLVEVVVAVGVFALAIISIIGLVAALSKSVEEISDSDDASRVVTNLQGKLQSVSFSDLRAYMATAVAAKPLGSRLYASRDGTKVGLGSQSAIWDPNNDLTPAEEDALKYFVIELQPNDTLSPSGNDNTAGFLAFTVRLIYPAYLGNGDPVVDSSQQNSLLVPVAITR